MRLLIYIFATIAATLFILGIIPSATRFIFSRGKGSVVADAEIKSVGQTSVNYRAKVGELLLCKTYEYNEGSSGMPLSTVIIYNESQTAMADEIVDVVAYQNSVADTNLWHTLVQVISSAFTSIGTDTLLLHPETTKIWINHKWGEVVGFYALPFFKLKLAPFALSPFAITHAQHCIIGPAEKCRVLPIVNRDFYFQSSGGNHSNSSTPYCDSEYRAIRQYFGQTCLKEVVPSKLVVISRQKVKYRRVVNWESFLRTITDVAVVALDKKVTVVALEDMTICEQIATISSASVVVSLRGAGEALIIFMSDSATFINIYHPKEYWFPVPAQMAHLQVIQFPAERDVYCPGVSSVNSSVVCNDIHNNWADWMIDERKLRDALLRVVK